jgi:hypothetical protein
VEQLGWGSGLVAIAGAIAFWLPWFAGNMNHALFTDVVVKLLRSEDRDRARKLTMAAPRSPYAIAVRAAIDARAAGDNNPRVAFDAELRPAMEKLARRSHAALASLAAGAFCVYAVTEGAHPLALIGPGIAVLLLVHAWRIARGIAVAGATEADRVIAAL